MSIISKLFTVLASSALVFSGFSGVAAHAEAKPTYLVVNSKSGIFFRDAKCNKAGSIGYGNLLSKLSDKTITCTVNGQSLKYINANAVVGAGSSVDSSYIAEKYVSTVVENSSTTDFSAKTKLTVNAVGGLYVRNDSCKIVGKVANGTVLDLPQGSGGTYKFCRSGNKFFEMIDVQYKGSMRQVAVAYVK